MHALCFYSILNDSLTSGNKAVEAIMNYTYVIDILREAANLTVETNSTLNDVLSDMESLSVDSLIVNSSEALQSGLSLNSSLQILQAVVNGKLFVCLCDCYLAS